MDESDGLDVGLPFTDDEVELRRRYEVASILNDLLIAAWFTVGSVLFFSESTTYAGTWLFLVGSVQLAIRPTIRLSRRVHLQRRAGGAKPRHESSDDF